MVQKIYSKMHLISCTNTHRDVTDLVNHGMVKNTKTWISWERNIIFLWNKKILNLCFKWHILRSYRFVVEVTFKHLYSLICDNWVYRTGWLSRHIKKTRSILDSILTYHCAELRFSLVCIFNFSHNLDFTLPMLRQT